MPSTKQIVVGLTLALGISAAPAKRGQSCSGPDDTSCANGESCIDMSGPPAFGFAPPPEYECFKDMYGDSAKRAAGQQPANKKRDEPAPPCDPNSSDPCQDGKTCVNVTPLSFAGLPIYECL